MTKLPKAEIRYCDRCTALGETDQCITDREFVRVNLHVVRQNPAFDNCTTIAEVQAVSLELPWREWSVSWFDHSGWTTEFNLPAPNEDQTYCERWFYNCSWSHPLHHIVVPAIGHELIFNDAFVEAVRSGIMRSWGVEFLLDPNSHYNGHNRWRDTHAQVCLECWENGSTCEDCGQRFPERIDWHEISGEYWVCDGCYEAYSYCVDHERNYRYECPDCQEDERVGQGYIHSYGYKPDPYFTVAPEESENWDARKAYDLDYWRVSRFVREDGRLIHVNTKAKPVVFLGFELEVEAPSGSLGEGAAILGQGWRDFLYLKQDGSLTHGMEIVSHPLTLRAHKQLIDWSFLDKLRDLGFTSFRTNTCGLHVHVNRACFDSDAHMYKFGKLFADNPTPMQRLGGRDSSRWGTFDRLGKSIRSGIKRSYDTNRYQAVNFQNPQTLELRFFKGTLRDKRVWSALELTDAAVEYTRQLSTSTIVKDGGVKFSHMAKWAVEQPQYENLAYFINTFGLLGSEDLSWRNHDSRNEMEI